VLCGTAPVAKLHVALAGRGSRGASSGSADTRAS
jgi:hypothetical protein